jgi:hypothetical protein
MEPFGMLLALIVFIILLVIVIFILWEMIYSVKEVRMAALVIVQIIKNSGYVGGIIGGALELFVKTFIWF